MKNSLIMTSLLIASFSPYVVAESLFDKLKKKAEEIITEQETKADQKIDQTIDETVDSAEKAVYEGGDTANTQPSNSQVAVSGDNGNAMLVKMTQTELKRLGYPVSVDGAYGPGTRNAILAYEADNGRQLTGNVSPDLINALKGTTTTNTASTPVQTAAVQPAAGTQTQYTNQSVSSSAGVKGQGQMQQFYTDCESAKATSASQQAYLCWTACANAAKMERLGQEVPAKLLNSCAASHQAAMDSISAKPAQQPVAQNATTVAAATEASHGALAPYINEMRALGAECQSIPGDDKNVRTCARNCNQLADLFMGYKVNESKINESIIQQARYRLDQCKQRHKWAMESQ